MNITNIFDQPKIIGIVGNKNTGKSDFIYWAISELQKQGMTNIVTYGLRKRSPEEVQIYSVLEFEMVADSVVFIDEFKTLLDTDNRKKFRMIESTLRLNYQPDHNNIVVLSGLPENYHKYLSAQVDLVFFMKSTIGDFINNSSMQNAVKMYDGDGKGSVMLSVPQGETIMWERESGKFTPHISYPYLESMDAKRENKQIFTPFVKNVPENVPGNVFGKVPHKVK